MKRLLKIFELSANEQRVVLIVILLLITIAFIRYQHRVHQRPVPRDAEASPTPAQAGR